MKKDTIIKTAIVVFPFLLAVMVFVYLYQQERKNFATKENPIYAQYSHKADSLKLQLKSPEKEETQLEAQIKKCEQSINSNNLELDKLPKRSKDPKYKKHKNEIDSLTQANVSLREKKRSCESKLRNCQERIHDIKSKIERCQIKMKEHAPQSSSYKPSWHTIVLFSFGIVLLLVSAAMTLLFTGKIKKKPKIKTMNDNPPISKSSLTAPNEPNSLKGNPNLNAKDVKLSFVIKKDKDGSPSSLEISSSEPGAHIYYTIGDGDNVQYKGPIMLKRNCTIKAYPLVNNMMGKTFTFEIDAFMAHHPIILVTNQLLSISAKDADIIFYTIDGTQPTEKSSVYTQPIQLADSCTIKAVAYKKGCDMSAVSSFDYSPQSVDRVRVFTSAPNLIGISYQGDSHVKAKIPVPCQDCHSFTKVNDVWNIAVVSDGAGSKEHSDIGSNAVCAAFPFYISDLLKKNAIFSDGNIADEKTWDIEFRSILYRFQDDIKKKFVNSNATFDSYAATIIVLVYSKKGYMVAHIGDGRAGIKTNGKWKSIMTPHKGEEANQTIFSTTIEFANKPGLKMSGIYVPETSVSEEPIESFVLMSDGCENGAWSTYQKVDLPDGDFKIQDVNLPRPQTLDMLLSFIDEPDETIRKANIIDFLTQYKEMKREGDDKTIIIGSVE